MELTGFTLTLILVQTDSNGDHEQGEYGICSDNCPVSVSAFVSEGGGGRRKYELTVWFLQARTKNDKQTDDTP